MSNTVPGLTRGSLFPQVISEEMINLVRGKSAIAELSNQRPIAFNGNKEFTFSFDKEVDIVGENAAKSHGGITVAPITVIPLKMEYGARVTDEFRYGSEELRMNLLRDFAEGFARKVARGIDIAAFHGFNPRTGEASTVVNGNDFDDKVDQTVDYDATEIDENLENAIAAVEANDYEVTGIAISPAARGAIAALKNATSGARMYPEFAFGGQPGDLGGKKLAINSTVSTGDVDHAIVGDFATMFRWGIAKQIPLEVIEYGDPDGSGYDLKQYNQVYLRSEIYVGWAIADPDAFARVVIPEEPEPGPDDEEEDDPLEGAGGSGQNVGG